MVFCSKIIWFEINGEELILCESYCWVVVSVNWVVVSVIAVFWATIPNPTRPRVADSGTPYRYIG